MFRTKKNMTINKPLLTRKSSTFIKSESSTDECSNHKSTINQFKHKISPNINILNNKYLSTQMTSIPSIPSIASSDKKNFNYKKDDLIKEVINNDILPETANKFRSLYDSNEQKVNMDLNIETNNRNNIYTRTSSLMSKNTLKKNYCNIRENSVDNFIKNNILKKNKRKIISINKLKIIDNSIMTPRKIVNMKSKNNIYTIEKNLNNSDFYFSRINSDSKRSRKDPIKYNMNLNKNNMSNISIKDYSYYNDKTKMIKERSLKQLNEIINYNNISYLKINRDNRLSLLTHNINKNKKIITLHNNINFDYLVNSCNENSKKRLKLNLFSDKKEKTDFLINSDFEESKSNNSQNKYRIKKNIFYNVNIPNKKYYKKRAKIKTISENKKIHIYLDSSPIIEYQNHYTSRNHNNNIFCYQYKDKINKNNYKILLNDVKNRMSILVNNLINYIQFLKNEQK